ncbi:MULTISPECIES: Crp/Fnr family transcriptional regulator [Sphingomonas]|uniref:Crp/Fnr family transcriptional regulator n=1 Tax=Sphingomonas TaxID=13687 RepID=UPI00177E6BA1|nr:Crp/Fnr family transcriptional regulator [Sphingomonas sp. CFBP 13733]MBD8639206.1 Crp/Fnr family transcriptional regulator [Sphingomonas sp. CFBP 13733]
MDAGWDYERFKAFTCADDDDIDTFRRLAGPTIGLKRGDTLRMQGSPDPQVYMLLSGWVACSIIVGESARQIVKVHLPGDLVGMPSLAAPTACDTIEAVSAAKLGVIETAAIGQVFSSNPRLAALLFLVSQQERVLLMERLASIGRTSAASRIAALILELRTRLRRNDPTIENVVPVPLTQEDIGDMTGLTPVYVNRTLRQLRTSGIATWRRGVITIDDRDALAVLAALPQSPERDTSWIPSRRG